MSNLPGSSKENINAERNSPSDHFEGLASSKFQKVKNKLRMILLLKGDCPIGLIEKVYSKFFNENLKCEDENHLSIEELLYTMKPQVLIRNNMVMARPLDNFEVSSVLKKLFSPDCIRSQDLNLDLSQGSFGKWNGEKVAVKVFKKKNSHDHSAKASWKKETKVYESIKRSPHLISFIKSFPNPTNGDEFWIVTKYYPLGNLSNFLQREEPLELVPFCKMVWTILTGLAYLHLEFQRDVERNGIAHRNLNGKCIFVQQGHLCVIGDLGLAAMFENRTKALKNRPQDILVVGTPRYMAMEVLNETCPLDFNSLKATDVFSIGLVFYEMLTKLNYGLEAGSPPPTYRKAYFADVPEDDPTVERMRDVVVTKNILPAFPSNCDANDNIGALKKIIQSTWVKAIERPDIYTVKRKLLELFASKFNVLQSVFDGAVF